MRKWYSLEPKSTLHERAQGEDETGRPNPLPPANPYPRLPFNARNGPHILRQIWGRVLLPPLPLLPSLPLLPLAPRPQPEPPA
mgnify:CR=1 FL=1